MCLSNLMLARASRRAKEFAVRGALGATRGRLVRQLLTRSGLLFLVGGAAAGTLVAHTILKTIDRGFPDKIRGYLINYGHVDLDLTALVYTFGIAALCGIVFGLVPAFQSSGLDVNRTLKEASGQLAGNRHVARTRRIFVGAQIALAVVVMICTALLVESFIHMTFDRVGFNPSNVVTTQLALPKTRYAADADVRNFYDRALARIQSLPEVASAAAAEVIPFGDAARRNRSTWPAALLRGTWREIGAVYSSITPTYLSTMQISILRGRSF